MKHDYPMVKVVWYDAESEDQWVSIEDYDTRLPRIISIGYLVEDSENGLVLAQSIDCMNDKMCMVLTIPNHWVEDIKELN